MQNNDITFNCFHMANRPVFALVELVFSIFEQTHTHTEWRIRSIFDFFALDCIAFKKIIALNWIWTGHRTVHSNLPTIRCIVAFCKRISPYVVFGIDVKKNAECNFSTWQAIRSIFECQSCMHPIKIKLNSIFKKKRNQNSNNLDEL